MLRWKLVLLIIVLVSIAAISEAPPLTAHAATTRVWTGAVNLNWSTPGNWSPAGAPIDGDSVVIGAAAAGKTLTNDIGYFDVANNRFVEINLATLTLNTYGTVVGNPIGITSAIHTDSASPVSIALTVDLKGDVGVSVPQGGILFGVGYPAVPNVALTMAGHTLTKTGNGGITFAGDVIGAGTLASLSGVLSIAYPVSFGGAVSVAAGAQMNLTTQGYPGAYCGSAPNASFAVEGLMLLGCGTSIRALSGSGSVGLYRQSDPLLIGGVSSGFFSGRLSNAQFGGSVICCGSGEQTFSGASTMFGYVLISAGSLLLNGATFATNVQFTVQGGAGFRPTLGGFGTFGPTIVTDGNLALDSVRGQFGLARFPSLQLAPSATLTYEIKGATPGTGFTQLVVNGDTFLGSALLSVDFNGYQPATGQSITLLTGATALFDTFRNAADESLLPEGAVLSASGMKFTITYKGGTGRDVVITRQAGTPATPGPTPKPTLPFKRFLPMVSGG